MNKPSLPTLPTSPTLPTFQISLKHRTQEQPARNEADYSTVRLLPDFPLVRAGNRFCACAATAARAFQIVFCKRCQ
jgi:hypothetical protein